MKQLSGLDATFLYLETPQMPMHVGALHVFELPAGFKGRFVTALRKHIASRLPVAPVLRRRLWWMPLNMANPAWVDAEPDMSEHIVEVRLPPSARVGDGMAELQAEVGRLHPVLLDRRRPLWKFHIFEGLAPGATGRRRVAMYTQLHHAAVDGQAAVALANAILDTTPEPRAVEARSSKREKTFEIGMTEMLRGVLGSQAQKVAQIIRELPGTVGTLGSAAGQAVSRGALPLLGAGKGKGQGNLALAPRTPFNASVTDTRAFAAVTLPLAEVKALGRASEGTINDIVLWLCSTALRRYLAKRQALPRKSLIAAVPISLREKGDTTSDNQASMSLVNLGTNIADPRRRLVHVKTATAAMKSTMGSLKNILPTDFPSLGVPWLLEAATALYGKAKVAERIPQVANVVISNVPGPPVPLYLAGARMVTNYPTSIVVHGIALNITVQSYDQSLDFGLMADAESAPDVAALAEALRVAMDDLRVLAGSREADLAAAEASAPGLVGRTTRRLREAVDKTLGRAAAQAASKVAVQATAKMARGALANAAAAAGSMVSGSAQRALKAVGAVKGARPAKAVRPPAVAKKAAKQTVPAKRAKAVTAGTRNPGASSRGRTAGRTRK
ncbi:MAG: wax ester/triacylglycerol synthase family O-acyltransferase [Rubrivivax sp.]|nr:wax ester/triacylglycerol synthase family O-acyltransferase [Rubrivivax sp.]